ncbi:tetratricopeptide repeat protein [Catellatospora coxensis]
MNSTWRRRCSTGPTPNPARCRPPATRPCCTCARACCRRRTASTRPPGRSVPPRRCCAAPRTATSSRTCCGPWPTCAAGSATTPGRSPRSRRPPPSPRTRAAPQRPRQRRLHARHDRPGGEFVDDIVEHVCLMEAQGDPGPAAYTRHRLALALGTLGRFTEAAEVGEEALSWFLAQRDPEHHEMIVELRDILSRTYAQLGEVHVAVGQLDALLELVGGVERLAYRGDVLERAGSCCGRSTAMPRPPTGSTPPRPRTGRPISPWPPCTPAAAR